MPVFVFHMFQYFTAAISFCFFPQTRLPFAPLNAFNKYLSEFYKKDDLIHEYIMYMYVYVYLCIYVHVYTYLFINVRMCCFYLSISLCIYFLDFYFEIVL